MSRYGNKHLFLSAVMVLGWLSCNCSSSESTPAGSDTPNEPARPPTSPGPADASDSLRDAADAALPTDAAFDEDVSPGGDAASDAPVTSHDTGTPPPVPYSPCPPAGAPCRIMPVGDSITAGYNSTTGGGYRLKLLHDIWAANHDATFVGNESSGPSTLDGKPFPKSNEGHSGYTIDDAPALGRTGISGLVPAALSKNTPHIVLLMIGTNDVGTNNDLANAPSRLANLIDAITLASPKALLVVAQITPPGDATSNARAQTYNAAIPGLVKARIQAGKHIIVVDMYSAIASNPKYATDWMNGLHPNDAGYDVLGNAWYAALAPYL